MCNAGNAMDDDKRSAGCLYGIPNVQQRFLWWSLFWSRSRIRSSPFTFTFVVCCGFFHQSSLKLRYRAIPFPWLLLWHKVVICTRQNTYFALHFSNNWVAVLQSNYENILIRKKKMSAFHCIWIRWIIID